VTKSASGLPSLRQAIDAVFGSIVMGTVGVLIGLLTGPQALTVATGLGVVMGVVIGLFGGRRFLFSILIGTVLGGLLAWFVAGADKISLGAGAGAAMGGFLGVQSSMLLDLLAERKRAAQSRDNERST
jgi:MFS family permease